MKNTFDEVATSQYEIQNNVGNLLEKTTAITAEVQNITKSFKKDILENFSLVKSEIKQELKNQKQEIVTTINSIRESIESSKALPFVVIFCTMLIIGVMVLLKFVF